MKVVTIVGARPQFIKAAAVSRVLRRQHQEVLVHTGQHYDENMSAVFFSELSIPKPDYNLDVGSDTHARQTAAMMVGIEDVLLAERPDALLLYGDTNSTLAGAITAAKLDIPIAHVEAGVRCGVMDMPEEQNRIVTDHLSHWCFAPSDDGMACLAREGIIENAWNVGDVMYDAMLYYGRQADARGTEYFLDRLRPLTQAPLPSLAGGYYLATVHRPENVDRPEPLSQVLAGLNGLAAPVLFPVHPRTRAKMDAFGLKMTDYPNIAFVEPLGYIEMIYFTKHAKKVVTDSGGLHKEAYLWKVPGVVILRNTGWVETLQGNWNVLARPDARDIMEKAGVSPCPDVWAPHYGDGNAARKITDILSGQR